MASSDKERIKLLEERIKIYEGNQNLQGYLSLRTQLHSWDAEMLEIPISLKSVGDDDMRAFDKVAKYLERRPIWYKDLENLRASLTPKERDEAEEGGSVENMLRQLKKND